MLLLATGNAQERDRARIPDRYKWDLAPLYSSDASWRAAKAQTDGSISRLETFKGRLGSSASTLADALDQMFSASKALGRLSVYASLLSDQDTRDSTHRAMRQEMTDQWARFSTASSYIQPEILKIAPARLRTFQASEPRLKPYGMYLGNISRKAAHTLSDAEERVLAASGPMSQAGSDTFEIFLNADFPFPAVALANGTSVRIDQAAYTDLRASANRGDRERVMAAYFTALGGYSRTFGTTMNANLQQALFHARSRKYESTLAASVDDPNIPVTVYSQLIRGVNANLATLGRYLKLRQRMLGVSELHYYDLYAPLVSSVNLSFTPEEAQKNIAAGLAPLGADYISTVQRAFAERWIDVFPNDGKTQGAYSDGSAYDVHPYILLNYNGHYDDMGAMAHELGHAMHSVLANRAQPYPMADHSIFVSEVASLTSEALMKDYMLTQVKDPTMRLAILGNYVELLRQNVFRQTQFADFELRMHQMAERGEAVTGASLAKLYLEVARQYYGHAQGTCIVDDYVANEWSMVSHFYRPFYVYQYATSFTAATAFAQRIKSGGPAGEAAAKQYLAFLSAGGSKYPIDLLKDAGIDMTTDEPLELTMREINGVMDEMEKILASR